MINEAFYTTKELSSLYGVSTRTVHNRLEFLRNKYPDSYFVKNLPNGRPRFYYKKEYLNKEMLTMRSYPERRAYSEDVVKERRGYTPPPRVVESNDGEEYNWYSLKALMMVLSNEKLLKKFMALNTVVWLAVLIYVWRI